MRYTPAFPRGASGGDVDARAAPSPVLAAREAPRDEKLRHREISLPARARARDATAEAAASPRSVSTHPRDALAALAGLDADDFPLARAFFWRPPRSRTEVAKKAGLIAARSSRAGVTRASTLDAVRPHRSPRPRALLRANRAPRVGSARAPSCGRPAGRVSAGAFCKVMRPRVHVRSRVRRPRETRATFDARPPRPPAAPDGPPPPPVRSHARSSAPVARPHARWRPRTDPRRDASPRETSRPIRERGGPSGAGSRARHPGKGNA